VTAAPVCVCVCVCRGGRGGSCGGCCKGGGRGARASRGALAAGLSPRCTRIAPSPADAQCAARRGLSPQPRGVCCCWRCGHVHVFVWGAGAQHAAPAHARDGCHAAVLRAHGAGRARERELVLAPACASTLQLACSNTPLPCCSASWPASHACRTRHTRQPWSESPDGGPARTSRMTPAGAPGRSAPPDREPSICLLLLGTMAARQPAGMHHITGVHAPARHQPSTAAAVAPELSRHPTHQFWP
jgi:hypothetical protein